jgi:hypothetical protein
MDIVNQLNYEVPKYPYFKPYKERNELKWLFCDRCERYIGGYQSSLGADGEYNTSLGNVQIQNPFLFWCPNCNEGPYVDGERMWDGEPIRLCNVCLNLGVKEAGDRIHPNRLYDGRPIDYHVPLDMAEFSVWSFEYRNRTVPDLLGVNT